MKIPYLKQIPTHTIDVRKFGGINLSEDAPLKNSNGYIAEWEKLRNMDFDNYPAISSSKPMTFDSMPEGCTGVLFRNDGIVYTDATGINVDGNHYELALTEGIKNLVAMGAYIIILPDWVVFNSYTKKEEFEDFFIESGGKDTNFVGVEVNQAYIKPYKYAQKLLFANVPESLVKNADGEYKIKQGDKLVMEWDNVLNFSVEAKAGSLPVTVKSVGVESFTSKGGGYVSVVFDTSEYTDMHYYYTIQKQSDANGVAAVLYDKFRLRQAVLKSSIKDKFDFVIEHNNRLWACSSANHEVYCSKLGDPTVWGEYSGISTDSWTATIGSDGDFTGACVYNDNVLFFKENCVHIVHGSKASNFTITTINLRGVQKGAHNTLCICNSLLYYKSPDGIYAFNGAYSQKVDDKLGDETAIIGTATNSVGVADDRYIYMIIPKEENGTAYVYDYVHNVWSTESFTGADRLVKGYSINGCLYATTSGYQEPPAPPALPTIRFLATEDDLRAAKTEALSTIVFFIAKINGETFLVCNENGELTNTVYADGGDTLYCHMKYYGNASDAYIPLYAGNQYQSFYYWRQGDRWLMGGGYNGLGVYGPAGYIKLYNLDTDAPDSRYQDDENLEFVAVVMPYDSECSPTIIPGGIARYMAIDYLQQFINEGEDAAEKVEAIDRKVLLKGNDILFNTDNEHTFEAETGWVGRDYENTHFNKLSFLIGAKVPDGARLTFNIKLRYDYESDWFTAYSFDSDAAKPVNEIFTVPIIPRRAERIKIRIDGQTKFEGVQDSSEFVLYGMKYVAEGGSEI